MGQKKKELLERKIGGKKKQNLRSPKYQTNCTIPDIDILLFSLAYRENPYT